MMGGEWTDLGGWAMGLGMVTWVLVLAVIIGFVVWLMNRAQDRHDGGAESAEDLLRRRFAGGDIDAEEYERRLEALRR